MLTHQTQHCVTIPKPDVALQDIADTEHVVTLHKAELHHTIYNTRPYISQPYRHVTLHRFTYPDYTLLYLTQTIHHFTTLNLTSPLPPYRASPDFTLLYRYNTRLKSTLPQRNLTTDYHTIALLYTTKHYRHKTKL